MLFISFNTVVLKAIESTLNKITRVNTLTHCYNIKKKAQKQMERMTI